VIKLILITAVIILSTACSLQPQTVAPASSAAGSWQQHQQRMAELDEWKLTGKLGFRAPQQGGSAALQWTQKENNYQMLISGPFGVGSAKIAGNDTTAEMLYGDTLYHQPPQQLAMRLTGVPLPVDALSWWVRGLPSPTQPAATDLATAADGLAIGFDQAGWELSFSRYRQTDAGLLPGKITGSLVTPNTTEDSSYSFKLIISSWNLLEEEYVWP
jgi:outer membrane lipoprotein LolB